jgi:hypothetical protein
VHFIDNINLEFPGLRLKAYLLYQRTDIIYRIIAGSIKLMNVQGRTFVKGDAGMAFIAGFSVGRGMLAIDGFGENPCAGGLSHAPGSAEQESMGKLLVPDCIFQGGGNMRLAHHGGKILRSVLSCRNDKIVHTRAASVVFSFLQ